MTIPLGLSLGGGILQNLPADSSLLEVIAALNQAIDKMNTWDGVIVQDGITDVEVSANPQSLGLLAHGLTFTPVIEADLNNIGIAFTGSTTLSLPLPAFLQAGISGGNVNFQAYMFAIADATNIYFYSFNATGVDLGTFQVTYRLKRTEANQNT